MADPLPRGGPAGKGSEAPCPNQRVSASAPQVCNDRRGRPITGKACTRNIRGRPRVLVHRARADLPSAGRRHQVAHLRRLGAIDLRESAARGAGRRAEHHPPPLALAYPGRKAEAITAGEKGVAMRPISADASAGPYLQHQLVRIYLLVGEPEKALDRLEPL